MTTNKKTKLGATGPDVFPIALGCMGMTPGAYTTPVEAEGIATIHAAIERGVNLLDTGDFYSLGENEMLVRRAIAGRRDKVLLSVKFGATRGPDGSWTGFDTRPVAVQNFVAYSLKRLGTEVIDIYRPTRLDPAVPIEDTVGAVADLVKKGYVRHIGLSEVGAGTIRRAAKVHPIVDVQLEYSLANRSAEEAVLPALEELGIGATLYGVLVHGLLSGSRPASPSDFRAHLPQFAQRDRNEPLLQRFRTLAEAGGRTPAQLCIAWALAKQPTLVPAIGARTPAQLESAVGALERPLTAQEMGQVESLMPPNALAGATAAASIAQLTGLVVGDES